MVKYEYTDVRSIKEFGRIGYNYRKVEQTDDYVIWELSRLTGGISKTYGWEVWKPKWVKNPDGSKVWAKPSDEDFGRYGWYCTNWSDVERRIEMIIDMDF